MTRPAPIDFVFDPTLPRDVIEFRDGAGKALATLRVTPSGRVAQTTSIPDGARSAAMREELWQRLRT